MAYREREDRVCSHSDSTLLSGLLIASSRPQPIRGRTRATGVGVSGRTERRAGGKRVERGEGLHRSVANTGGASGKREQQAGLGETKNVAGKIDRTTREEGRAYAPLENEGAKVSAIKSRL